MSERLMWLQKYYASLCDGDWEHAFVMRIETLDNPGWKVDFDVEDTPMEEREFGPIKIDRTEQDWVHCKVENRVFKGRGGPLNLTEILTIFQEWVEKTKAAGP